MFASQFTCNSRNLIIRIIESSNFASKRNSLLYEFTARHITSVSPEELETSPIQRHPNHSIDSNLISTDLESSDVFGSLKKSLERKNSRQSTRGKLYGNVKVLKEQKRIKTSSSNEADIFGNLSNTAPIWYPDILEEPMVDNKQSDDSTIVRNISREFKCPKVYLEKMKTLVSEKKLKDALDLFIDMKRNYVTPIHPHYTFMIGACGRVGYTEMAFKLLRQMTDRGLQPTPATLTGLFNACGESPFPEYGLKKALLLKEKIQLKNWHPNQITYQAMIKAFGRCGDIQTAFQIVDEMVKAEIKIGPSCYNFLLMSCISNKEAGFTYAIEVWRKMKERKSKPDIFAYNLLLRAARECGVGPEEVSSLILQHWSSYSKRPYGFKTKEKIVQKEILQLPSVKMEALDSEQDIVNSKLLEEADIVNGTDYANTDPSKSLQQRKDKNSAIDKISCSVPSVLGARPINNSEILDLGTIKTAADRLAVIGGGEGLLLEMKKSGVQPNIKTFTLILDSLPPNTEAEEHLLSLLDAYNVKPDVGFFNILIKRRNFRLDDTAAHQVLLLINKWGLSPDIITFGVLALGCRTYKKATFFIRDMRKLGLTPNTEIVGSLLASACKAVDFEYLANILKLIEELEIEPNERMLSKMEKTLEAVRRNIIDMEHGKSVWKTYQKEGLPQQYKDFCKKYEQWLKSTKFEKQENVWSQYKTDIIERNYEET